MSLIESEKLIEKRIGETCAWRSIQEDLELSDYQYLYINVMNHLFSGCNAYSKDNRYFLHFDSLSFSDQLHQNKIEHIQQIINSLQKDYLYPHSIDLLYLNHFSSDKVQSILGNLCREVALVKDFNNEYILIGNRGSLDKAKKTLIQLDQLVCNQFFLPDPILQFLKKQPTSDIYSIMERMLQYQVQVHPKEAVSQIKEKKRITNIRPQIVNKEFVFRSDCPFNTSFHFVIEGKSPQSFLKKFPSSNKVVLLNSSLWKQLSFVEQAQRDLETQQIEGNEKNMNDSSLYPGTDSTVQSTANPDMLSLLEKTCQDSIFQVMNKNAILEKWYHDMNELNRNTNILTTEESFIQDKHLNINLLSSSFSSLLSLLDSFLQSSPQQPSISFIIPTLLPSQYSSLEASYLTQLFCVFLQKARSFPTTLDVTIYFLIQDPSHLKDYRLSFEKLVASASFSASTQKESVVLIGMKKEMKEIVPLFTDLLNDLSSFSIVWNKSLPIPSSYPFSLVSWNILAANYAKAKYWTHVSPAFLKSKYRHTLIMEFLFSHQPNFFCLQECDDYFSYWKGAFASLGYSSVYLKRPDKKEDGCCIGYDSSQFTCEKHWSLQFDDLDDVVKLDRERFGFIENGKNEIFEDNKEWRQRASSYAAAEVPREKMSTPTGELKTQVETCFTRNIGLICLFRDKKTNEKMLVATTHLFWNPKYYQIKLFQSMYLLRAIQLIREKEGEDIPVFITMDSNTLPYSVVYNYYCSLNSFLPLHSAYETYYHGQEPLITNYSYDFIGCLDYIFYNPGVNNHFEKCGVMDLPSIQVFKDIDSLPSRTIPSDHLPIALFGKIHSVKREVDPSWTTRPPIQSVRSEMDRPFFKHVYFGYICLLKRKKINKSY